MAFVIPAMPLLVDIYTGPYRTRVLRHAGVSCNLAWGRRSQVNFPYEATDQSATPQQPMTLLLPAGTDIWDGAGLVGSNPDVVECPAGSGRWYCVFYVDDIGKGFSNEHRAAVIFKIFEKIDSIHLAGLAWPQPIP